MTQARHQNVARTSRVVPIGLRPAESRALVLSTPDQPLAAFTRLSIREQRMRQQDDYMATIDGWLRYWTVSAEESRERLAEPFERTPEQSAWHRVSDLVHAFSEAKRASARWIA